MKTIVIAGGTGFLGQCITNNHYHNTNTRIIILSRKKRENADNVIYHKWDGKTLGTWKEALENADVLINLNGRSVDCRYNKKNKALIYNTRIQSTEILGEAIQLCQNPPKLWINSGSATIYRHAEDREMDEDNGEFGDGFSVDVCKKWEAAFDSFELENTRKVTLRTGIVFGKSGGALKPLINLSRLGLGGRLGSGTQYFSWLHEDDFNGIIDFLIENEHLRGVFNVTSPLPITNDLLMQRIRQRVGVWFGIPQPKWLLELGAWIIRTETELILKSRRVVPRRLLDSGFKFKFTGIGLALNDLIK